MIERQRVLARFGELALRSEDLHEILTEACRLVADALGADLAKIMEVEPEAQELFVRAGVGWNDGIVGVVRLPMQERSSETCAIEVGEPVITPDIAKEKRFVFPDFLIEHGVKAIVNVPIFTPGPGPAYGLLQVDNREPREFDEQDTEFLRTYASILGPVIDRLHKVHDLRAALTKNEGLLKELQHRIKNNIGVITGIVWMRSRATESEEARHELQAVAERIETLRLVHEQLYAAGTVDRLPLRPYLTILVESLASLYDTQSGAVRLNIDVDDVELAPEVAAPLGLILNEFTTNRGC
ncbi:histidine kinase dimerization/phosphoacceptor domain -containing protein [Sphingomonas sp. Ant20]|uniref:sensor histidine kinase n=1 Tax=Sphingomonas sp. Ant20 TaxID=104605 RepID=UPI00056C46CD|nr:histidine kinase dimerization/phosphoacceptor domain -containing protein [Sphingomonas sp. Ant20]